MSEASQNPIFSPQNNENTVGNEVANSGSSFRFISYEYRHIMRDLPVDEDGSTVGWVADGSPAAPRGYSLGTFKNLWMFKPIAYMDLTGTIYMCDQVHPKDLTQYPIFMRVLEEGKTRIPHSRLLGYGTQESVRVPSRKKEEFDYVNLGAVIARGLDGEMHWTASIISTLDKKSYTVEQSRVRLERRIRANRIYPDAMATLFFGVIVGQFTAGNDAGFGTGNIYQNLRSMAPLAAIRRSVAQAQSATAAGLRTSGLEDFFCALMTDADVIGTATSLEAKHGKEPLNLVTVPTSHLYRIVWEEEMSPSASLQALKLEGYLNRVAAVSNVLENNFRLGLYPTEDSATLEQIAQIDAQLINNPAFDALSSLHVSGSPASEAAQWSQDQAKNQALEESQKQIQSTVYGVSQGVSQDVSQSVSQSVVQDTRSAANYLKSDNGESLSDNLEDDPSYYSSWLQQFLYDPLEGSQTPHVEMMNDISSVNAVRRMLIAAQELSKRIARQNPDPRDKAQHEHISEWVYRQSLSTLLTHMRLPLRMDSNFRAKLENGVVGIGFTTADPAMMPKRRFDAKSHTWKQLSSAEKGAMSAQYNLRVGIMLAALAFGVDTRVSEVSLHIDSLGLEEAAAQEDENIEQWLSQAIELFERMQNHSEVHPTGSKADPKDGDVHGRSATVPASTPAPSVQQTSNGAPDENVDSSESGIDVDKTFSELIKDLNFDAIADELTNKHDADSSEGDSDTSNLDTSSSERDSITVAQIPQAVHSSNSGEQAELNLHTLVTVTFEREHFIELVDRLGLTQPQEFYEVFHANMNVTDDGVLTAVSPDFDLRDSRFAPLGSQEEPELLELNFDTPTAAILGTDEARGLSIQREDALQHSINVFHRMASSQESSALKAEQAMTYIREIGDPELLSRASDITSAIIDGCDTPDLDFSYAKHLDQQRVKAREQLFSGHVHEAIETQEIAVNDADTFFSLSSHETVPRYFNSYAERVVYNRLFATHDERTVLIPDNLFYAHLELADILMQIGQTKEAIEHLNTCVAYAPAYPMAHMRLAVALGQQEDWDSAQAATQNALRVSLDRQDAAFAYYRYAFAAWMKDEFALATACYIMSASTNPQRADMIRTEYEDLVQRAKSQGVSIPTTKSEAAQELQRNGVPVWPHTEVASIVRDAARVCVDEKLFVPARTLAVAAARFNESDEDIDLVQLQYLRSLNS